MAAGEFAQQQPALTAAALVGMLAESLIGPLFLRRDKASALQPIDDPQQLISELNALCLRTVGATHH